MSKKKIAILGGGIGSLSAAYGITNKPGWQDEYEITLYQMGWRLGGKCASGRRPPYDRIEEHGLHIWIGFYDNSFRMIQAAYAEMNRPDGAPMQKWTDALKPHSFIVIEEFFNGKWSRIPINFPTNDLVPGDENAHPSLSQYIHMALQMLHSYVRGGMTARNMATTGVPDHPVLRLVGSLFNVPEQLAEGALLASFGLLVAALDMMPLELVAQSPEHHSHIRTLVDATATALRDTLFHLIENDDELRHVFELVDLALATIRGLLDDGVLRDPNQLDSIDNIEFRAWLIKHGAEPTSAYSGFIRALYDLAFGYIDGDAAQPDMAAGVAIRSALRIGLGYKGAIFWKMQAGMGDIVMTPLYDILKKRGVNFKFFHNVKNLGLNEDKSLIETVSIGVQATLKSGEYQPLVDVKGLPCWPSLPQYDQLIEGDALQASGANLESFWTDWVDPQTITLQRGVDFDEVILGIPVGAHPYICSELISAKQSWADMTSKVQTCRTLAMQLWLNKDLADLGWPMGSPVMDGYAQKFNTWADMSQLMESENFPDGTVKNVAYYCGPMPGGIPPRTETGFPAQALAAVQQQGISWLGANSGYLWPKVAPAASKEGFDYSVLVDPNDGVGEARFYSQYQRANIDPSERYVLSVTDSTKYRMKPGESGFDNLKLAGDWTENELNVGCVEATVMSGLLCANAVCGYPELDSIAGLNHA